MTKLEEIARAMYAIHGDWNAEPDHSFDIALARAAVEALRLPSQAQYDGLTANGKMWRETNSTEVYVAMIDAILNESP